MKNMYTLILLSGGTGSRMQNAVPKQYLLLAGKPVIMHILDRVDRLEMVSEVIVVCTKEYESAIELMLKQYCVQKPVRFAPAGRTRQESVLSGLSMVQTDDVIVHEAARPFVKVEDFRRLIDCESRNAIFGAPIPFTVVKGHKNIEGLLERSELINVQLPQKFETALLQDVHNRAVNDGKEFTEDASMVYYYHPEESIEICLGMDYDIKLTTRTDMLLGEKIYDDIFRMRK